jgi:hypothetical protein
MSVELQRLHSIAGMCLDLLSATTDRLARELLLDLADHFATRASLLDSESAPSMPGFQPELPGRDAACAAAPEKE